MVNQKSPLAKSFGVWSLLRSTQIPIFLKEAYLPGVQDGDFLLKSFFFHKMKICASRGKQLWSGRQSLREKPGFDGLYHLGSYRLPTWTASASHSSQLPFWCSRLSTLSTWILLLIGSQRKYVLGLFHFGGMFQV